MGGESYCWQGISEEISRFWCICTYFTSMMPLASCSCTHRQVMVTCSSLFEKFDEMRLSWETLLLVCTIVGGGSVSTNSVRSACRCMACVVVSLMAIISASHTFSEVESKLFAHHEMG